MSNEVQTSPAEIAVNGAFVRQANRFSAAFGDSPDELPVEKDFTG